MKRLIVVVIAVAVGVAIAQYARNNHVDTAWTPKDSHVAFSPNGGCFDLLATEIRHAQKQILVQAYSFTSKPVAKELADAIHRGVKVRIIVDRGAMYDKSCVAMSVLSAGAELFVDGRHAIAHNKVMIIDSFIVVTGSYNFTDSAEKRNAENIISIADGDLAKTYEGNWLKHAEHSERVGK